MKVFHPENVKILLLRLRDDSLRKVLKHDKPR